MQGADQERDTSHSGLVRLIEPPFPPVQQQTPKVPQVPDASFTRQGNSSDEVNCLSVSRGLHSVGRQTENKSTGIYPAVTGVVKAMKKKKEMWEATGERRPVNRARATG